MPLVAPGKKKLFGGRNKASKQSQSSQPVQNGSSHGRGGVADGSNGAYAVDDGHDRRGGGGFKNRFGKKSKDVDGGAGSSTPSSPSSAAEKKRFPSSAAASPSSSSAYPKTTAAAAASPSSSAATASSGGGGVTERATKRVSIAAKLGGGLHHHHHHNNQVQYGGQPDVSTSKGAMRLNRILEQPSMARISYLPKSERRVDGGGLGGDGTYGGSGVGGPYGGSGGAGPYGASDAAYGGIGGGRRSSGTAGGDGGHSGVVGMPDAEYVLPSQVALPDPTDERAVGDVACRINHRLRVDPRSIGGSMVVGDGRAEAQTGNVLLKADAAADVKDKDGSGGEEGGMATTGASSSKPKKPKVPINRLTNECLFSMRVHKFDLSGGTGGGHGTAGGGGKKKGRHLTSAKARNKLRYVCIVRSTNRPLLKKASLSAAATSLKGGGADGAGGTSSADGGDDDLGSDDGYDHLYNPEKDEDEPYNDGGLAELTGGVGPGVSDNEVDDDVEHDATIGAEAAKINPKSKMLKAKFKAAAKLALATSRGIAVEAAEPVKEKKKKRPPRAAIPYEADDNGIPPDDEISSFPALMCLTLHSDGTNPDTRTILELDKLVSVESLPPKKGESLGAVQLTFRTGDRVEIDFDLPDVGDEIGSGDKAGGGPSDAAATANRMRRERFLWSLLQIHAILCTSVVERTASYLPGRANVAAQLPPLTTRSIDRSELQYTSTANGFLSNSPALIVLLERQRNRGRSTGQAGAEKKDASGPEVDEMDGFAYDMMMGNYGRFVLFANAEERKDAAEVLNATPWQQQEITSEGMTSIDAAATADTLAQLLQKRMRDLEAETCRRLIAWEDEKHFSLSGGAAAGQIAPARDTVDALSLAHLFQTLDDLDTELEAMEGWLQEKAAGIKPLTDECRGIEEENRQLEQQYKSFEMLKSELHRLLSGLEVPQHLERVLANPNSVLVYDRSGTIDVEASEDGVELIHEAGQALKAAMDRAQKEGGVHLLAVSDSVKGLASMASLFCTALAQIIVTVMEQLAADVVAQADSDKVKGDSHTVLAKKIRDTQRKFQSSLLSYIKLIEVLAVLKPSILPAIRDAYSELVCEGVLSKKRMKKYFASLPGRGSSSATHGLKDYNAVTLRSDSVAEHGTAVMKPLDVQDIEAALREMLPVIAREAYFTAALFGLSSRHLDGREKKRNFESAKKSVDHSSQYFRYYMSRICGISSDDNDVEGKKVSGDPMLSLVASIHLNEAMDGYVDRQKKGGDHSLSLAYVRATILDFRKKVDKQWVSWVEDQIRWIRSNHGVPPNGKRAGIFASISRFPCYLDHVLICCKAGRPKDYAPNLSKIKVVSYYLQKMSGALFASLHECAERETTDQQYAANVMRMENSYFFTQSIKQRGPELTNLFQKQITAAGAICKQSTDAYLGWMIKREFKAMHSLFSNISRIRRDVGDADVPIHVPRAQFVRTLQKESNKEIMKEKIGIIYSRMEKHLSEAGGLLPVAWKALVKVLYEWFGRWEKLSTTCYKFILEPSAVDVVRIAKAAGGRSAQKSLVSERVLEKAPAAKEDESHKKGRRGDRGGSRTRAGLSGAAAKKLDVE